MIVLPGFYSIQIPLYRPEDPRILTRGIILYAGNVLTSLGVGVSLPLSASLTATFPQARVGDGLYSLSGDIFLPPAPSVHPASPVGCLCLTRWCSN